MICGTPQRPGPVTDTELICAYEPSEATTPLSVTLQDTFAAIGLLPTIVPGALNEPPAGAIVAANAAEDRTAHIATTAPLHTRIFKDFMI